MNLNPEELPQFLCVHDGNARSFVLHTRSPRCLFEFDAGDPGNPKPLEVIIHFLESEDAFRSDEQLAGRDPEETLDEVQREAQAFFVKHVPF